MENEIKRDYYLDQLIKRKNNGLIKIVTGIRRCGKSYLLRTIFKKHLIESGVDEAHIVEMAFDLYDNIVRRRITIGCNSKLNFRLTPIRPRGLACNCTFLSA